MHSRLDHINTHIFWLSPFITTYTRIAKSTSHLAGYMLPPRYRRIYVTIWPYQWINRAYVCLMGFLWPWGEYHRTRTIIGIIMSRIYYMGKTTCRYTLCVFDMDERRDVYICIFDHIRHHMSSCGTRMSVFPSIYCKTRPILPCTYGQDIDIEHKEGALLNLTMVIGLNKIFGGLCFSASIMQHISCYLYKTNVPQ